jgi:putative ABC transport system permease protein
MGTLLQDLRYGLRMLRKSPGFTLVAILTLALGIGANTTIFSVMNATLLRRLSFPEANRLVLVWQTFGKNPDDYNIVSAPNYWDFERQNHVFQGMALFDSAGRGYNLAANGSNREPEQVSGLRVSASFFNVLGVQPFLGRSFLPEEEVRGKDREVILSYGLWTRRYGSDATLVGKTIKIDGEDFAVVGVMPREFHWEFWSSPRELWVPAGYTEGDKNRSANSFIAFARLKPGVTVAQANAEMEAIGTRLAQQYPYLANMSAIAVSMSDFGLEDVRRTVWALFAAVGFVLLIACVNIANLLLARGATRQKEFALRLALGASGPRIARQLLTESVLLALLGGVFGVGLAVWSAKLLPVIIPQESLNIPLRQLDSIPVDGWVLGFALLASCVTGVLFGLMPAASALRGDVSETLKEGSRGSTTGRGSRLRHALVASEVALALIVLSGAGLMIESMAHLLSVDPGFKPKNVLAMEMSLPQEDLYNGPPGDARFCQNLDQRVSAIPGVIAVGAVGHLPLQGNAGRSFAIEGQPDPGRGHRPGASYSVACPNYFKTMGVALLAGREFNHQDTVGSPGVIVINQTMAQKFWPKENPVGKRIRQDSGDWMTVVGVVGDVRHWGLDSESRPQFFRPYTQAAWPFMNIVVRTTGAPSSYAAAIKKALSEIEPDRPVSDSETLEDVVRDSVGQQRFSMLLLSTFALLALALAAVGILGVVSYSVAQRTHEIGIRVALGARAEDVLKLMLSGSMTWVGVGIGAGVAGSLGLTRLLGTLLYDVKPSNPAVLGTVALLLMCVGLLASYIPARRAARIDPMVALRNE